MKIIIILIILISALYADIEIQQNIRALYKGVNITQEQKDYLIDNHDENIKILKKSLKTEVKKLKRKYINEKNVVSFNLKTDGTIGKISFLKRSNNELDKSTKKAITNIANKLVKTNKEIIIRFIISYKVGQKKDYEYDRKPMPSNREFDFNRNELIMPISRGTTRFQHDSKEYIRTFTTSRDGYINLSVNELCMRRVTILTELGQQVKVVGKYNMRINKEIPQGKYKILLKTDKVCDVNLEYQ